MTKQAQIRRLPSGEWRLDTGKTVYRITSINAHCTGKLEVLHDAHKPVYMTLEKITEYASDAYRCKVSSVADQDWRDDDVYCLVTNETGNLNINAARDIAAANEILRLLRVQ